MFFTPKNLGIGQKIFELGPSEAEISQIVTCPYYIIWGAQYAVQRSFIMPIYGYNLRA